MSTANPIELPPENVEAGEADMGEGFDPEAEDRSDDETEVASEPTRLYRDPPVGYIRLRPSNFKLLPSTIFFEYPPELGIVRQDDSQLEYCEKHLRFEYASHWERNCIKNAFRRAGMDRTDTSPSSSWTALWSKHQNSFHLRQMNMLQKVNHFPSSWCIGRKDRLLRTLTSMKRLHGSHFDFHPMGFILPNEKNQFMRYLQNLYHENPSELDQYWIMKPVASSCGKGIRLVTVRDIMNISKKKKMIIQKYLSNPFLINGFKFDLRMYVLLAGVDPMRVYIYNEGLVRLATAPYSLRTKSKYVHLTNYSINKNSSSYKVSTTNQPVETDGSKWSLHTFKEWLSAKVGPERVALTFERIHDILVKTMIAGEGEITSAMNANVNYYSNCYELFGCDIFLDEELNPHLIEVNVSPSLTGSTPLDKIIKGKMTSDLFHIVGLYPYDPILIQKLESEASHVFSLRSPIQQLFDQEEWRKCQIPAKVDMNAALSKPLSLLQLLMIEEEMARALSSGFALCHPKCSSTLHYLTLYRNPRFSDHFLSRWLISGGSRGTYAPLVYPLLKRPIAMPPNSSIAKLRTASSSESSNRRSHRQLKEKTSEKLTGTSTKLLEEDESRFLKPRRNNLQIGGVELCLNENKVNIPVDIALPSAKKVAKRSRSTPPQLRPTMKSLATSTLAISRRSRRESL